MADLERRDRFSVGGRPPAHILRTLFAASDTVELQIVVANLDGVNGFGFAFDGAPVPMSGGKGHFFAPKGQKKILEWVMIGDPGGTMKVTVTRDGDTVKEREKSTIAPPETKGFDAFEIEVS